MKIGWLEGPPTRSHLERLYHELSLLGASCLGKKSAWPHRPATPEELLALSGDMLRYDARLLSILLQFLLDRWREVNPLQLRLALRKSRWPQAILVVFEFARQASDDREIRWMADYVSAGFSRISPPESFFIGISVPGSRMSQRRQGMNLAAFTRWGFIGQERPIADRTTRMLVGRFDRDTRRRILQSLIARHGSTSLAQYLDAVEHSISRQQALADLQQAEGLVLKGRGRGARWTALLD